MKIADIWSKVNFTFSSRYNKIDLPVLYLPVIGYKMLRNGMIAGFMKIISFKLKIKNKGILIIHKRLFVNLFTNTLNASWLEPTYIRIEKSGKMLVKGNTFISNGCRFTIIGNLTIGHGTYFNARTSVLCFRDISIGEYCSIAWDVTIMDSDVHYIKEEIPKDITKNITEPITIGNHVWIGAHAKIMKGVSIGDGAVVAANSLVIKNVNPNTLVGGVPAKTLKENIKWE